MIRAEVLLSASLDLTAYRLTAVPQKTNRRAAALHFG